jgi:hypothetical protein
MPPALRDGLMVSSSSRSRVIARARNGLRAYSLSDFRARFNLLRVSSVPATTL